MILIAAAIYMAGNYTPSDAQCQSGEQKVITTSGSEVCVSADQITGGALDLPSAGLQSAPVILVQQSPVFVSSGGYYGGFRRSFHLFGRR